MSELVLRQLFEPESSTYTYLIGNRDSGKAVLVDPVLETFMRDLDVLKELGFDLAATIETHIHADHLTSALKLNAITDCEIVVPAACAIGCATRTVAEDQPFDAHGIHLRPIFTPGHTDHHHCYAFSVGAIDGVLTGDCLLIDGCGRVDFQGGDVEAQFSSVRDKLFALPDDTLVYPGHDYHGRHVSSIGQEKTRNPRLGLEYGPEDFRRIMDELDLPYPKKIDAAVPANLRCGQCPDDLPDGFERLCEPSIQG